MDAGVGASGAGQQQGSGEGRTPEVPKQKRGERPRQQIRKAKKVTRRRFSAEDKSARPGIRIVMEGIRGEEPVSVLCQREGIDASVYYRWLKDFMEAGKQRLRGDALRDENARLKQLVADHALDLMALKKGPLAEP
jgi:transposase